MDHTVRFQRNTGIQRCVRSLSRALLDLGVPLQPVIWNRQHQRLEPASSEQRQHLARWAGPAPSAWQPGCTLCAAQWLLIPELVSGPHNPTAEQLQREARRHQLRLAWLFHDAIPVRWAFLYAAHASAAAAAHGLYMDGLAGADLVLANSHTTACHLRAHWIHRGVSPRARLKALPLATELPGTLRLPPPTGEERLVLCVGSLEPRKNHRGLLKALTWMVAQGCWPQSHVLVLAGWPNDPRVVALVQRAEHVGIPVRWESHVSDTRLLELYRLASFTVYPSLEEGFGLPVAESLWHRRPCLCSNEGALAELAHAGGCRTLNTANWRQLVIGLWELLHKPTLRGDLQREINGRSPRLWRQVAQEGLKELMLL